MTVVVDRARAIEQERVARTEDFYGDLMPEAAQLVVLSGLGSAQMLQRKMRLPHAVVTDLLVELHELGVVGPATVASARQVLVKEDGLAEVLARIATLAVGDEDDTTDAVEDDPVAPLVSLVKTPPPGDDDDQDDWPDDEDQWDDLPGGELVLRPRHPLARLQYVALAPQGPARHLVTRARQATARQAVWVADQPVVARGLAVGRQLPGATFHLALYAPRGVARVCVLTSDWLRDARSAELLAKHAAAGEGESYAKVAKARADANLAGRRWSATLVVALAALAGLAWWVPAWFAGVLAVAVFCALAALAPRKDVQEWLWGLALAGGGGAVAWWFGPDLAALVPRPPVWAWWVLLGIGVLVFGWLGRHEDKPLMQMPAAMAGHKPPAITAPMVIGALCALGNSKMKDPGDIRVLMDPHRAGPGVQIDLELPPSVTATWVMENRERLAAALRRNLGTVWPSVGVAHPGHFSLFISDLPVTETEQEPWPLASSGPIDIFTPQPVFTDQLGRWVYLNLAYASWVVGAVPRMGKTFVVRELLLIYGMDPRVKVIALDGKGTGDLSPLIPFAHTHVRGARVDKPEGIGTVRATVSWLLTEMGRRTDALASLPAEEVPDSKITSQLVDDHPELDLGPIALGIDETQSFFSYGFRRNKDHKEIREEIRDGVIELMRMGPAVGIWVIMATQTVRDSTIPSEAQAVAVYRYALKMEGWEPNDKVLGTGAFKSGIDATMFGFDEKGIGWLKGEGAKPQITRSVVGLDAVEARAIAVRCRSWRNARTLLTGEADEQDGVIDAEIVVDIVQDAETVMVQRRRDQSQWLELVEWLRELRPDHYADLDVKEVSTRLPKGPDGKAAQVWSSGKNLRGVRLADLRIRAGS